MINDELPSFTKQFEKYDKKIDSFKSKVDAYEEYILELKDGISRKVQLPQCV